MHVKLENLYQRYMEDTCTKEERAELLSIIAANPDDPQLMDLLDGTWNKLQTAEVQSPDNPEEMLQSILTPQAVPVVKKLSWLRITAAASIVFALAAAVYFYKSGTADIKQQQEALARIAPGTNKATLTLSDGKVIALDNTIAGEIARQSGIVIRKTQDGQLVYHITEGQKTKNTNALAYNTISTPRGGQYQVNLPDGTKIWLNASSSLKYPAAFTGKQRRVELAGEAYFEVAKDKTHPFVVATDKQEVQVLGTHFNINSYADESVTKTTLLEGSVKVASGGTEKFLLPGQQAALRGGSLSVYLVDTDEAVAWKNGNFQFNEADMSTIMRQLSRWYNIDISFESKPSAELFHFKVKRSLSLADVLKILESNSIKFKIEGRKLIVKS